LFGRIVKEVRPKEVASTLRLKNQAHSGTAVYSAARYG
jgi:hypothetical protein